jgi:hypothetical protein
MANTRLDRFVFAIVPLDFEKAVTLAVLFRGLHRGGLPLCHLSKRTAVFDRHHFAE